METTSVGGDVEAGFAKLQGEDFEYYMQTYSIIFGLNSKNSTVDVDLSRLGGGMNISRRHARIFYDFARRRFALEVLGKNGCFVEGVLHLPSIPPVKFVSQDLLQIGDKEFYFLLPVRSILVGQVGPRHQVSSGPLQRQPRQRLGYNVRKGRGREQYDDEDENEDEEQDNDGGGSSGKRFGRERGADGYGCGVASRGGGGGDVAALAPGEKKGDSRSRVDRESDNQQLLQLEEKDVVSSVATVLSDLCSPGEWMPMEKLHSGFHNMWHHSRVRRCLTLEDWFTPEADVKPWYGLLMFLRKYLRKYPEHFVINLRSKNRVTQEFISLVSVIT